MSEIKTTTGWNVLHLFCSPLPGADAEAIRQAVKTFTENENAQVVPVALLGHKADLAIMALGPEMWALRELQTNMQRAGLAVVDSFVSLTEISEYAPTDMSESRKKPRLYPILPPEDKNAFCFYPMSKRRNVGQNWYEQPYDERHRMMAEHGKSGMTFAGRIVQLITGSTGLDDWEWGVTLFGTTPNDLKECVYTMRYDEASTHYAEFGPFYTGMVGSLDEVLIQVGIDNA